jgi:hypothetical protein
LVRVKRGGLEGIGSDEAVMHVKEEKLRGGSLWTTKKKKCSYQHQKCWNGENVMLGRYIPSSEENSAVVIERRRRELSRMYARRETPREGNSQSRSTDDSLDRKQMYWMCHAMLVGIKTCWLNAGTVSTARITSLVSEKPMWWRLLEP